jgi:hypothetical protein
VANAAGEAALAGPAAAVLRPGLSIAALKRVAASMSDTEAARRMQQAKYTMFEQIGKSA